jgi:DNA-binding beta-propeller fold protein YncE
MRRAAVLGGLLALAACQDPPCGREIGDLCLLAGTGEFGFNGDGLRPRDTDLYLVSAARRGPDQKVYIMDFNNQRVRRIIDAGDAGLVETVIGSGYHAIADVDAQLLDTPLENPIDFGFLADGRMVFVSYHDPRVLVIADDGTLDTIAGANDGIVGMIGNEGDGGPAREALFIQLDGIAVADNDVIYVSDSLAHRVRKIEGGMIETVAGTGEREYSGDGGPAIEAGLNWPTALALDRDGNLYIADTFNHAIRRLAPDGTITTIAGSGVEGDSGDGGPAIHARLRQPFGVAVDEDGSLYIGDRSNFRVRRVDVDGVISTVAGSGVEGVGSDGRARESRLGYLARVAIDGDWLLVADQSNAMIWRLRLR